MLMGVLRTNVPAVFASGRSMMAGRLPDGKAADLISVFEDVAACKQGGSPRASLKHWKTLLACGMRILLRHVYSQLNELPVRGAWHGITGQRHHSAISTRRNRLYRDAAKRVVEIAKAGSPKPRDIVTLEALDNAFALDMAMGEHQHGAACPGSGA